MTAGVCASRQCSRRTSGSEPRGTYSHAASRRPRPIPDAADHAQVLVAAVTQHRDTIDAQIERVAPAYPVVQLARIDRALLRSGMGELLHCPATPTAVAISEWVELARTYSGELARRLLNGVLGRVAREQTGQASDVRSTWTTSTEKTDDWYQEEART